MLKYKDFVPQEIEAPGFFKEGKHESFDHAIEAANDWLVSDEVSVISIKRDQWMLLWVPAPTALAAGINSSGAGTATDSWCFLSGRYRKRFDCGVGPPPKSRDFGYTGLPFFS